LNYEFRIENCLFSAAVLRTCDLNFEIVWDFMFGLHLGSSPKTRLYNWMYMHDLNDNPQKCRRVF
jgi:hypothetical protein